MKTISGKKWTTRELAEHFGCSVDTITNHANKLFGRQGKGIVREFDEFQATAILESIKSKDGVGRGTSENISEVETELSLDMQIAIAERKAKELWKEKAQREEARAIRAESQVVELTVENGKLRRDNASWWKIAEDHGLALSDKDDLHSMYRR